MPYKKDEESNMPKVSVIVPVYNVEKYIGRCIESILAQTFTDFELILVDDGSPDKSGTICDEYAKIDSRVRVIHKENGGVSSARNKGLDEARGEWIVFVDSDDWVEEEYLSVFFVHDTRKDGLVLQGMIFDYDTYSKPIIFENRLIAGENFVKEVSACNIMRYGGPCCKLFNNSIIQASNIRFPLDYSYGEDTVFFYQYLVFVNEIRLSSKANYHYIQDSSVSLMRRVHPFSRLNKFVMEGAKYLSVIAVRHNDKNSLLLKNYIEVLYPLMVRSCLNSFRLGCSKSQIMADIQTANLSYGQLLNNHFEGAMWKVRRMMFRLPASISYILFWTINKFKNIFNDY